MPVYLQYNGIIRFKVKGCQNIYHNHNQKDARVVTLIRDKVDFRAEIIREERRTFQQMMPGQLYIYKGEMNQSLPYNIHKNQFQEVCTPKCERY